MPRPFYALTAMAALVCANAALGQTPLAPESGVLALRNGYVIFGQVIRAGDYFVVTTGEGSELRLKSDEVESFCSNLQEVYEFKRRHLSGATAQPYLELARWCLRHALYEPCREQLLAAEKREPGSAQVAELTRRLKLAQESPAAPAPAAPQPQAPLESVETTIATLPKGSIEKFGAIVQPLLLNRCAANQCHGPNAKSEFRLLRPPPGQIASRRFTQRNLYATLRYLDRSAPEASPLIMLPQQRHGSSLAPVFDKHSAGQLAELIAWARSTTAPAAAAAPPRPATIGPLPQALSQPVVAAPTAQPPAGSNFAGGPIRVMRPPEAATRESPTGSQRPPSAPHDRYDPEIFNRRYHAP